MKDAVFLGTDTFITGNCSIKKTLNLSMSENKILYNEFYKNGKIKFQS